MYFVHLQTIYYVDLWTYTPYTQLFGTHFNYE